MEQSEFWREFWPSSICDEIIEGKNEAEFTKWIEDCIKNAKRELKMSDIEIMFDLIWISFKEMIRIKYNIQKDCY